MNCPRCKCYMNDFYCPSCSWDSRDYTHIDKISNYIGSHADVDGGNIAYFMYVPNHHLNAVKNYDLRHGHFPDSSNLDDMISKFGCILIDDIGIIIKQLEKDGKKVLFCDTDSITYINK